MKQNQKTGKKINKEKSTTVLRSLINKNTTIRRLHKDLEGILREDIPIVGVAALPLDNDLFKWHGNIRGPVGTLYEGGVFHFEIQIPELYPHLPPKIVLFNPLPHPNVIGDKNICLDMLQTNKEDTTSWSSNYSILSILLQLQGYLFEDSIIGEQAQHIINIKQAIKVANQFRCPHCKHSSKYAEWPPFNKKEQQIQSFYNQREVHQIIEDNFICYHTKLSYRKIADSDSKEKQDSCLGILLNITKTPKTGLIKSAQPSLDYVSIKGFINEGIRKDSEGKKFTHWLPLYFGNLDNRERVFHLLKKAISMIITNSTRSFQKEQILEVFPSILLSVIVSLSNQKIHPSVKYLRILTQVYALWLMCMEEWPELYAIVDDRLNTFIHEEKNRNKDLCPNLGIMYILLYVSKQYKFNDLIDNILREQFDRQVFWLIKEIPELDDEKLQELITPQTRAEISFKQQQSSYQMICIQYLYLQVIQPISNLTNNFCLLKDIQEIQLQQEIVRIQKTIDSYNSFYDFIHLPRKTNEELDVMLRTAIQNSRNKGYHGNEENMKILPQQIQEQMQNMLQNHLKLEDYFDIQVNKVKDEFEYIIDFKEQFAQFTDADWKQETIKRFQWIQIEINWNPLISATEIAQIANHITLNKQKFTRDRLYSKMMAENTKYTSELFPKLPFPQHTWLQLFAKLDFEQYLLCLPYLTDMKEFYKKLYCAQEYIVDLVYPIQLNTKIKSDNFLLTTINILRFQSITLFNVHNIKLPDRIANQIKKGFKNLRDEDDCQVKQIHFVNLIFDDIPYYYSIYSILKEFESDLEVLQVISSTTEADYRAMDDFGHILSKLQKLKYLVLNDCLNGKFAVNSLIQGLTISNKKFQQTLFNALFTGQNQELSQISQKTQQELRMGRQLEYVDLSHNQQVPEQQIAEVVSGLSMFPNLKYLNLSKICEIKTEVLVNSLIQLVNVSVNLQILDCSNIIGLNPKLQNPFFIGLAENISLNTLRLNDSGKLDEKQMELLAIATYWNNQHGGKLRNFNLNNTNSTFGSFEAFCINFKWKHNNSYTLFKEYRYFKVKPEVITSISSLELSNGNFICNEKDLSKQIDQDQKEDLFKQFLKFIQNNQELNTINLSRKSMFFSGIPFLTKLMTNQKYKNQIKILNLSTNQLGIQNAQDLSKIIINSNVLEVLDISNNEFRAEGSKIIALAMHINQSIKSLNLFNNKIGVEGAKAFGQALKFNSQLSILDLGHNSIRNKGLIFMVKGLAQNEQSKLRILGLRFNFLTQSSISLLLTSIKTLHSIFVRNNQVNYQGLLFLKSLQSKITVDLFDNCLYYSQERMQSTIWVQPQFSIPQLIKFCKDNQLGIVVDVRTRNGILYPNRKVCENKFNFIEFADPKSVSKAMSLASMGNALIEDKLFRIYQAGTGTFVYQQKSSKQKKLEQITKLEKQSHLNKK